MEELVIHDLLFIVFLELILSFNMRYSSGVLFLRSAESFVLDNFGLVHGSAQIISP